jgi:hypothetical protein
MLVIQSTTVMQLCAQTTMRIFRACQLSPATNLFVHGSNPNDDPWAILFPPFCSPRARGSEKSFKQALHILQN